MNLSLDPFGPLGYGSWLFSVPGTIWRPKADIFEAEGRVNRGLGLFGRLLVLAVFHRFQSQLPR